MPDSRSRPPELYVAGQEEEQELSLDYSTEFSLDLETWDAENTSPSEKTATRTTRPPWSRPPPILGALPLRIIPPDMETSVPDLTLEELSIDLDTPEAPLEEASGPQERTQTRTTRAPFVVPAPTADTRSRPVRPRPIPSPPRPGAPSPSPEQTPALLNPRPRPDPRFEAAPGALVEPATVPVLPESEPEATLPKTDTFYGIPLPLQLGIMLFVALGVSLACPLGGTLPMLASAWEGARAVSLERGESLALGLASTSATRIQAHLEPSVHPFDTEVGVIDAWVVQGGAVVAPEKYKGQPAAGIIASRTLLTAPIRVDGQEVGAVMLDYNPRSSMDKAGSPLWSGFLALLLAGFQAGAGLVAIWWFALRPWSRLSSALKTGLPVGQIGGYRPMQEVVAWINARIRPRRRG